jgi:anaerobic selenocysteine-containing dehydrogenase
MLERMPTTTVRAACPHDCPDTCSMLVTVQDGVALRVRGNPDHPPTHGALCTKVSRYTERTYHPQRVLYPQKRVGPKGSGQFERVSWDGALSAISARLKEIAARAPEAILPYSYAGTMGLLQSESMDRRFFHKLGASRLLRTICATAGATAMAATYGANVGMHLEHFEHSKLIVIWGSNSITSNVHFWSIAQRAKHAGAKLICIDPRKSETAEKCDQHIAILPGTDGALALSIMHELIVHDQLDQAYIDQYTSGWPALRERALAWPPERAAAVCGITAEEISGLARDYATTKPAAIRLNYGMQRVRGAGNAVRLIAILPCLTGAWRNPSGGVLLSASGWFPKSVSALQRPELLAGRAPRALNMTTLGDDLLRESSAEFGPKVEALVVYNSNPMSIAPESPKVARGMLREDLFTVVLEHFMTDTADYADYVLPATTQLEHMDVHLSYGHTYALLNTPAIAPLGEAKPNTQIFRELAAYMGFSDECFGESDEAMARTAFERDVSFDELSERGFAKLPLADAPFAHGGFLTRSRRCEIDSPQYGVPDYLPNYESVSSSPELARKYPLAMISPPARNFLNSTFVNVESLQAIEREPVLEMHVTDAQARTLRDGQLVRVWNDRGEYHCTLVISERARPGVVNGLGIWWRKLSPRGTNVNEVTHQRLTDIGAAPTFYDCLVEVSGA